MRPSDKKNFQTEEIYQLRTMSQEELHKLSKKQLIERMLYLQEKIRPNTDAEPLKTDALLIRCDASGKLVSISDTFRETFLAIADTALPTHITHFQQFLIEEDWQKANDWLQFASDRKMPHQIHVRIKHERPYEKWISLSIKKESDTQLFQIEITPTTAQQRFARRLNLFEAIVLNTNDAVLVTDAHSINHPGPRIVYVNDAFTRMTGYTLEEVYGKTPRILQGPETNRSTLDKIRQALENWEPIEVELVNYRKNGTKFYVSFSIVPIADSQGYYTHWVSVQRDITERRQREQYFEKLAMAVRHSKNNIIITNADGKIEYVNPSFTQLTGYTLKEVKGLSPGFILQGPKTDSAVKERLRNAIAQGTSFEGEIYNYTKAEIGYWNEIRIDPVRDTKGELLGFVGVLNDVTIRNEISRKLYEQNKMLRQINDELDHFVYSVSHDLRAPLASIPIINYFGNNRSIPRRFENSISSAI